jgi:drug/metabolite transporter (DMT)-like permease
MAAMQLSRSHQGHAAMLLFSALVAGSFSLGALAAPHVDPAVLSALRFAVAAVILGAAARAAGGGLAAPLRTAPWRWAVLGGLMAAYFVLMFEGLKTATAISTAAVFTLTPIMTAGFGWLFLRQITTPRMALALALGAAGALWVIFDADLGALLRLDVGRGEAVYFIGCAAHAAYAVLVRRLNRGENAVTSTFLTLLAGSVLLFLWSLPGLAATDWAALPAIVWITLAYVSLAATATTTFLVQFATMRLPAAKVMAYTYLVPVWVILWELALHGLLPPALVAIGVLLIIAALSLLLKD